MLLGTLGASSLGNNLAGKGVNRAGEAIVRAGYGNKKSSKNNNKKQNGFLMPPHPLTNFEIQKYYHNLTRFNGVYSRDNLPRIKDGTYVKNLDEYSDIGTHWIPLYGQKNDLIYFDSFGVEHIPREIKTFISNKNIKTNICRIQTYDLIICRYFCIGFLDFMLAGKTLTHFTNNVKKQWWYNFKLFYD